jgi:predicted transcriptional regulator of viral defense system
MKFNEFLKKYQNFPILNGKVCLTQEQDPDSLRVQMSRWVKAGHLIPLKRGIYLFAPHFQKVVPSPYLVASVLTSPSYVSLEKALEFHGLIPEAVFTMTSVTTKRPGLFETPLGKFEYSHVRSCLFWGYSSVTFNGQMGFMAHPEKALLDLIYLRSPRLTTHYLDELRLQNMEKIDTNKLLKDGRRFEKPGMLRAAETLVKYIEETRSKEKEL